jgi:hypothetical protein
VDTRSRGREPGFEVVTSANWRARFLVRRFIARFELLLRLLELLEETGYSLNSLNSFTAAALPRPSEKAVEFSQGAAPE